MAQKARLELEMGSSGDVVGRIDKLEKNSLTPSDLALSARCFGSLSRVRPLPKQLAPSAGSEEGGGAA
jgi:hypothetical protein